MEISFVHIYVVCLPQATRIVSFRHTTIHSYIAMSSASIGVTFDLSMKMKTMEKDGLLFYSTDGNQNQVRLGHSLFLVIMLIFKVSDLSKVE